MSELQIITLPHESLRQSSQKVGVITDDTHALIERMIDQSLRWEDSREHEVTVALAAVQINELYKVVVVREDFDNKKNREFIPLINPEITKYDGEVVSEFEGCLSVKDYYALVPRHTKIKVKAQDLQGREIRFPAEGFLARILQHEIDHTKGVMIVDRVEDQQNGFKVLTDKGKLEKVDLEQVKASGILLDE